MPKHPPKSSKYLQGKQDESAPSVKRTVKLLKVEPIERQVEVFEREESRRTLTRADWDDPRDVAEYRNREWLKGREKILQRLVPDRRCPSLCKRVILHNRSWVISKDGKEAVCRSCFYRMLMSKEQSSKNLPDRIFTRVRRFHLDGAALRQARETAGMSVGEFARRAGWSRPYQSNMERHEDPSKEMSVSEEVAKKILAVLHSRGVTTDDILEE